MLIFLLIPLRLVVFRKLTTNTYVRDNPTNEAMDTVTNVVTIPKNGLNYVIDALLVQFDNCKIGCDAIGNSKYKDVNEDAVQIK